MAWGQYRTITIDETLCGTADSINFPVLVSGTYTYLKTTGNGGKVENANGYDIAFYSDSALTSLLDFERVGWSATTGTVEFYVEVPTLSTSADTVIYMAYGNAAQESDLQNATGTWNSNFLGVYHLEGNSNDSTGNNRDGTDTNISYGTTNAKFGQSAYSDATGSTNKIALSTTSLPTGNSPITILCWFRADDITTNGGLVGLGTNAAKQLYLPYKVGDDLYWGAAPDFYVADYLLAATWQRVGIRYDSTNERILGGGATQASQVETTLNVAYGYANIFNSAALNESSKGYIDEVYIINADVGASWTTADNNNQSSPSTFYAVGDEVPVGGGTVYRSKIGLLGVGNS